MLDQTLLTGFRQVVGQEQDAVGAQAFGFLGMGNGGAGRAARTGNDRHLATACVYRGLDDLAVLGAGQREILTRTTSRKQRARAVRGQPFQALDIGLGTEFALLVKVRDREGQQAGAHDGFEFLWGHGKYGSGEKMP